MADAVAQQMNLPAGANDKIGSRMEPETAARFFGGITSGEDQLLIFRLNADAVIAHVELEKIPLSVGANLNARRFNKSVRGREILYGFQANF